jgi:hypothetical protein
VGEGEEERGSLCSLFTRHPTLVTLEDAVPAAAVMRAWDGFRSAVGNGLEESQFQFVKGVAEIFSPHGGNSALRGNGFDRLPKGHGIFKEGVNR